MSSKASKKISIEETVQNFMESLRQLTEYATNADEKHITRKKSSSDEERGSVKAKKKVVIRKNTIDEPEPDVKKKKKSKSDK